MKKVISLLLAMVMVFGCGMQVIAAETIHGEHEHSEALFAEENGPEIVFDYKYNEDKSKVTVDVKMVNMGDQKVSMLQFAVAYDTEKLEIEDDDADIIVGEAIEGDLMLNHMDGVIYMNWMAEMDKYGEPTNPIASDCVLLSIVFTVIEEGAASVGFAEGEDFVASDMAENDIIPAPDVENGEGNVLVHDCESNAVIDEAVEPTCTETGLTEGKHCSVCGEVIVAQTVVKALGHTEGEIVIENEVAATCGTDGSHDEVVYCTVCGAELSRENIVDEATGEHVYATETERVEPTCTEEGYVIKACGCGATEKTVLEALGHTEAIDEAVEPTCTETGLTEGKHCSVCGEVIVAQTIVEALGHTEGETVVENVVPATCGTDGSHDEVVYCTVCGVEVSRENVVDKATGEHVYATETERVEPTCTEEGYVVKACGCGATEKTVLEALGHTEGEAVTENEVAATCEAKGSYDTVVYCTVCDAELSRVTTAVDALGHDHQYETTKQPGCHEEGERKITCSRCDYEETEAIEALGHEWGEWEVVKESTYTELGLKVRKCVREDCDDTASAIESEVLPKKVYQSNKPNPGVTVIVPGDKTDSESNPNTGAGSAIGFAVITAVCGAAAFISGKKKK